MSHFSKIVPNASLLTDVYDGEIYKRFYSENAQEIKTGNVLSYTLNTDGLALCEKSKLTLTPVILAINELPIEERFVIENVIIAGNTRKIE